MAILCLCAPMGERRRLSRGKRKPPALLVPATRLELKPAEDLIASPKYRDYIRRRQAFSTGTPTCCRPQARRLRDRAAIKLVPVDEAGASRAAKPGAISAGKRSIPRSSISADLLRLGFHGWLGQQPATCGRGQDPAMTDLVSRSESEYQLHGGLWTHFLPFHPPSAR